MADKVIFRTGVYRCPKCNHEWLSQERPDKCPNCGFKESGGKHDKAKV